MSVSILGTLVAFWFCVGLYVVLTRFARGFGALLTRFWWWQRGAKRHRECVDSWCKGVRKVVFNGRRRGLAGGRGVGDGMQVLVSIGITAQIASRDGVGSACLRPEGGPAKAPGGGRTWLGYRLRRLARVTKPTASSESVAGSGTEVAKLAAAMGSGSPKP